MTDLPKNRPKDRPGVNFIIILRAAFTNEQLLHTHIPKAQKDSHVKQLFALVGSACVEAASKHVNEIDPKTLLGIKK